MVKVPATHCSCYEVEISQEKNFAAMLGPAKFTKIFDLKNFRLYGISPLADSALRATVIIMHN